MICLVKFDFDLEKISVLFCIQISASVVKEPITNTCWKGFFVLRRSLCVKPFRLN